MQREIAIEELEKTLNEENVIEESIVVKRKNKNDVVIISLDDYKKYLETNLFEKLKKAEDQIENGEVTDADVVFSEMREKYGY